MNSELKETYYLKLKYNNINDIDSDYVYIAYYDNVSEEYYLLEELDDNKVDHIYIREEDIDWVHSTKGIWPEHHPEHPEMFYKNHKIALYIKTRRKNGIH